MKNLAHFPIWCLQPGHIWQNIGDKERLSRLEYEQSAREVANILTAISRQLFLFTCGNAVNLWHLIAKTGKLSDSTYDNSLDWNLTQPDKLLTISDDPSVLLTERIVGIVRSMIITELTGVTSNRETYSSLTNASYLSRSTSIVRTFVPDNHLVLFICTCTADLPTAQCFLSIECNFTICIRPNWH